MYILLCIYITSLIVSNSHNLYLNKSTVVEEITHLGRLVHILIVEV